MSVMRLLSAFDIAELTQIRLSYPQGHYYEAVENYRQNFNDELSHRINLFRSSWKAEGKIPAMPIDEFIYKLLMETGYYYYVAAMPGKTEAGQPGGAGKSRPSISGQFHKGLFNFTRFIENIKSSSSDLDLARVLGENDNVKRIMR